MTNKFKREYQEEVYNTLRDDKYYEENDALNKNVELLNKFQQIKNKFDEIIENNKFSMEEHRLIQEIIQLNNKIAEQAQLTDDTLEDKDELLAIMEVSEMLRCAIDNYQMFIDKLDPSIGSESTKKIKVSALTYIADVFKQIFQKLGEFINRKHNKVENILELQGYEHPKVKHNKEGKSVDVLAEANLIDKAEANLIDKGNSPSYFSKLCTDAQHRIGQWFKKAEITEIKGEIDLISFDDEDDNEENKFRL